MMGGEPGLTLIKFAPSQRLPDGYEVVHDGHLYWWQMTRPSISTDYGGGDVDRWVVRRLALEHSKSQ